MSDAWPAETFDRDLSSAPRVVVLFHASWCPHSRIFLPDFEEADMESPVPFARADLREAQDPRWQQYGIRATPTLVYYEHGEELERMEATRRDGLSRDALDAFLDTVHGLLEPDRPRRLKQRPRRAFRRRART